MNKSGTAYLRFDYQSLERTPFSAAELHYCLPRISRRNIYSVQILVHVAGSPKQHSNSLRVSTKRP